jgi:hypothetical protein
MSTNKRFFYVVHLPEGEFQTCVDAIRLVARPQLRYPAHVTVRGIYDRPMASETVAELSEKVRGKLVRVGDIGTFPPPQATAFFHCSCPEFLAVWDKPDFGYNPHVTIYDGDSREFAEAVAEVLERYPIRFAFRATGLDLLVTERGSTHYQARDRYCPRALADIVGDAPELGQIDALNPAQRLEWIERIASHLAKQQRSVATCSA